MLLDQYEQVFRGGVAAQLVQMFQDQAPLGSHPMRAAAHMSIHFINQVHPARSLLQIICIYHSFFSGLSQV